MIIEMIFELGLKQVVHNALKRIKPIMTTYTMRDGVEAECNEYYNADQMKQMFLEGWKCSHNWISVEDDLPPIQDKGTYSDLVLVCGTKGEIDMAKYSYMSSRWQCSSVLLTVTHWMPLPAPPMKGGNK